jgi:hypothetical protein
MLAPAFDGPRDRCGGSTHVQEGRASANAGERGSAHSAGDKIEASVNLVLRVEIAQ